MTGMFATARMGAANGKIKASRVIASALSASSLFSLPGVVVKR
jgi:hypothetical protein